MDEKKLFPAIILCFCLFVAGLVLLAWMDGCAVRHLPGGGTQPATRFEQVLAWNAAAAQANSGFADNVIGLQRTGFLSVPQAKDILIKQADIALADKRLTDSISAAALCATQKAGPNPTTAQLDTQGAACAQIYAEGISSDINLILGAIADLNSAGLLAVKDPAKRQALFDLLKTLEALVNKISSSLEGGGIVQKKIARLVRVPEVMSWA